MTKPTKKLKEHWITHRTRQIEILRAARILIEHAALRSLGDCPVENFLAVEINIDKLITSLEHQNKNDTRRK
jgi:hypothetical protein